MSEETKMLMRTLAQLIRHEGTVKNKEGRHIAYKCPAGKITIGTGRNLDDRGLSDDEAILLLVNDVIHWAEGLEGHLGAEVFEEIGPARRAALINMAHNLGLSGLFGFKQMLKALKAGDYGKAAVEALNSKWASQVGARALELAEQIKTGEFNDKDETSIPSVMAALNG